MSSEPYQRVEFFEQFKHLEKPIVVPDPVDSLTQEERLEHLSRLKALAAAESGAIVASLDLVIC